MALKRYQETFGKVQPDGDVFVLAGASVEVRDETSGALVAIFEDRAGNTAKANPFTADSNGYGFFYAADGRYRVTATLSGETVDVRDVLLGVGSTTVTTLSGEQSLSDALNDRSWIIESDLEVAVPGDYSDIQSAIDDLSTRSKAQGITITIRIQTGHALTKGVLVENGDYGHFVVVSDDATVSLDAAFVPATGVQAVSYYEDAVFLGGNAIMPQLGCLIDMADQHGAGYSVIDNSVGKVLSGCGVINAGKMGLAVVNGSRCNAASCNFSGANWGSRVTTNSQLHAPTCDFSGAKGGNTPTVTVSGLDISRGSLAYVTGASGNLSDFSGSVTDGLSCRRSKVSADFSNADNAGGNGFNIQLNSQGHLSFSTAQSCGGVGLFVSLCSQCCAEEVNCDGATGNGVEVSGASSCLVTNGSATGVGGTAIFSNGASSVQADGFVGTGAGSRGLLAQNGSTIQARDANVSGAITEGALATEGSTLAIRGANTRKGASDDPTDTVVSRGSIVQFHLGTGGISKTAYNVDSAGIIFV